MSQGIPLTDEDRQPWLATLSRLIETQNRQGESAILTCSALKRTYRLFLQAGSRTVIFVYLRGNEQLLRDRLQNRPDHFMKADMLASQLAALEEPENVLTVDASLPVQKIVGIIQQSLGLAAAGVSDGI